MARPRLIDRHAVLDAALNIADQHGLDAVTMSAVSKRLGVSAMALYRHVDDKADLLDGLVERLLGEVPAPDLSLPQREQMLAIASGVRNIARLHPSAFPLLLARPARTDKARESRDHIVEMLHQLGVPANEARRLERLLSTMVLGFAASEAAGRFAALSQRQRDADWETLTQIAANTIDTYRR